jgi:hypothetical protein
MIWQALYWKFVLVDRRTKIESGQRTTSFSFLLNDKRGVIGRWLSAIPAGRREATFMFGQLGWCSVNHSGLSYPLTGLFLQSIRYRD